MSNKILIGGVVLVAAGLLVFGRLSSNNAPASGTASVHNSTSAGDSSAKNLAPDFTLQKLGGGTISLSEFRGQKPVVVDFRASWCPFCRKELVDFVTAQKEFDDKVVIIAIDRAETRDVAKNTPMSSA